MKILISLALSLSAFSFQTQACSDREVDTLLQMEFASDNGVGVVFYGHLSKGDLITVEDMEKNNQYQVTNNDVQVFSVHGSYMSGYFIAVVELDPNQCQILKKYLIYEE